MPPVAQHCCRATFLGPGFAPPSMLTIILMDMLNEGQWSVSYTQPRFSMGDASVTQLTLN